MYIKVSISINELERDKNVLRKEFISDLAKMLAENQKEMLKLMAPPNKKHPVHVNDQDSGSEIENISVAITSTPVKTNATSSKTTPSNSRNSRSILSYAQNFIPT